MVVVCGGMECAALRADLDRSDWLTFPRLSPHNSTRRPWLAQRSLFQSAASITLPDRTHRSFLKRQSTLRTACSTPRARATPNCSSPQSTRGFLQTSPIQKARSEFSSVTSNFYCTVIPHHLYSTGSARNVISLNLNPTSLQVSKKKFHRQHFFDARVVCRSCRACTRPRSAWS
jgi:hypothetical protein